MTDISSRWPASLLVAATFLTRVPLPCPMVAEGGLARAMAVFPVIGAGIGVVTGGVFMVALALLPPLAAALLALAVAMLLTGALHEDGLADFADGLGARGDRDNRLAVMRDSRSGAYGVLALVVSVGLRAACLAAAPSGLAGLAALAAAGALSRAMVPVALQALPPARADGLGAGAGVPDASVAALSMVLALAVAVAGLGASGALAAAVLALVAAAGIGGLARRAFGGYTGDVLGAIVQGVEMVVLLVAAAGWR
jgi:adenosylcobinamide-GDP ribazoletransferase